MFVRVTGIPPFVDPALLLGPGEWRVEGDGLCATLSRPDAADLQARLRHIGIGGSPVEVEVVPALKRALVRAARTADARRRRHTTPGFVRPGVQLDDEGRMSLTPEPIALAMGQEAGGRTVLDACGGCGGNAIGFARAGSEVIVVEPDARRLAMARHNASIYGVGNRIRFVHGPIEEVAPGLAADLFFGDPPWGADWNRLHCGPSEIPLLDTLVHLADRFAEAWIKLPPSFDVSALPGWTPRACFGKADGDRHRVKFLLLSRRA